MELAADAGPEIHTAGQAAGWGGSGGSAGLGGRNAQVGGVPGEAPPWDGGEDPRARSRQAAAGPAGRTGPEAGRPQDCSGAGLGV